MTQFFRFVRHSDALSLTATGLWFDLGPLPGNHGHWSRLLLWIGEGEP